MIRTSIGILLIIAAIVWLPLWVQLVLFAAGVILVPYRIGLFIPAAFADALYAPGTISLWHLKYTVLTAVLLICYWAITTKTRVTELYAMEKK